MKTFPVAEREKLLNDELNRIIEIIKRYYEPEKIIVFGSLVNGMVHEWSDIDILIVKETTKRPIERCLELGKLLKPKVGIDLFIYTPEEYKLLLDERFSFLRNIPLKMGKIVYDMKQF
ncbi:MAG: nucleotidyltransferase domain-containing protein [Candidatus Kuenenia sp.]|nr:nucleotidyltransferase domain-containing protein [Candidatus Kuenenia hertensis]